MLIFPKCSLVAPLYTHTLAAIRNLCTMTAVVLRNLAAATAKRNGISSRLASNFLLFPLSLPCQLLSSGAFPISLLLAFLTPPPTGWALACVSLCKGWQS